MGKIIFVIIILIWCLFGGIGTLRCKENRVNVEMLIFILFVPFLAIIAHVCGLY